MNLILKNLGITLVIISFLISIPTFTALAYNESVNIFIIMFFLFFITGVAFWFISKFVGKKQDVLSLADGLTMLALMFIIVSFFSAVAYMPHLANNYLDSFFESVSGFTTTGLTMFPSVEKLPLSILLWRAETQWIGGIGIVIAFLFIISRVRDYRSGGTRSDESAAVVLYKSQGFSRIESGLQRIATRVLSVYLLFTTAGIVLLFFSGLTFFDSVSMTFTSLSTGGFVVHDTFYSQPLQLGVLCLLMILGSISFIAHNKLLRGKIKDFLLDSQSLVFFVIIITSVIVTLFVYNDAKTVIFEIISGFTTTGFTLTAVSLLPRFFIAVLVIGMIIGGCTVSTAGGIKVFRFSILMKSMGWLFKKLRTSSRAIIPFQIEKKPLDETDRIIVHGYFFTYLIILVIGTLIFLLLGYTFLDSSFQVVSALGTVGLSTMPLGGLPWAGKIVLIVAMLLGRLEIFPLLIVIRRFFSF